MFHTYPNAELLLPVALAPNGERSWNWIELGLKYAYFFATVASVENDVSFTRHFWFSHIDEVINMKNLTDKGFNLTRLDIFSPSQMNGQDGYRFDKICQIWRDKKKPENIRYILADGNILFDTNGLNQDDDENMELIYFV